MLLYKMIMKECYLLLEMEVQTKVIANANNFNMCDVKNPIPKLISTFNMEERYHNLAGKEKTPFYLCFWKVHVSLPVW